MWIFIPEIYLVEWHKQSFQAFAPNVFPDKQERAKVPSQMLKSLSGVGIAYIVVMVSEAIVLESALL